MHSAFCSRIVALALDGKMGKDRIMGVFIVWWWAAYRPPGTRVGEE